MTDLPIVSILIPCYNAERWIAASIESALAQTWPSKEVVVVDDGSTDGSLAIIRSFADRIRWETGPNRGGNAARNRLVELSRGEWLQFLDADDYLLPDKIASQLAELQLSSGAADAGTNSVPAAHQTTSASDVRAALPDLLYSPMTLEHWNEDDAPWRETLPIPEPRDPWVLLARWSFPGTHAVLVRRTAIQSVGGWKPDQPCCQEHELFLRLLQTGKRFDYCPRPGAIYRQWTNQSVCKKNPLLTLKKRLEVIDRLEEHLLASGQMTAIRKDAIAHSRLESSRSLYHLDRKLALSLAASTSASHPMFRIPKSTAFPWSYRLVFRTFGFATAERLADGIRPLRRVLGGTATQARGANGSAAPVQESAGQEWGQAHFAHRASQNEPIPGAAPRVSILIPCHNAERWIAQAIESALAQTWPNKEVIVVDDGSTDGSLEVIRSFGDRIHWETGPNRGGNVARNRLLQLATGEWLQYLDADDYLLPNKIAEQLGRGLPAGEVDVLYAPVTLEHVVPGQSPRREEQAIPTPRGPWILLARWLLPQTSAGLWRRSAIESVGGWKPDQPCCQEHELYFRLLKANKRFAYCPYGGAIYRQWSNQTVCKQNPLLTLSKRLEITDAAEDYLSSIDGLTSACRNAVSHARLECARSLRPFDPAFAERVAALALQRNPRFRLPQTQCFPLRYRLAYRFLGFSKTERLAEVIRQMDLFGIIGDSGRVLLGREEGGRRTSQTATNRIPPAGSTLTRSDERTSVADCSLAED